jgi:predicted dehydrogenase
MSDTMQRIVWGLIGCGDIAGKRVAAAISNHPLCRLGTVMCRNEKKAKLFALAHGAAGHSSNPEDVLSNKKIDAIYIATPPDSHCDYTVAAALAGKHVLCEKPMALSSGECKRMIAACQQNRVKLGVAYYRRCYPQVQEVRTMLEEGKLGKVIVARASVGEQYKLPPDSPGNWRLDPSIGGGGPLQDIGSHRLDLMTYLFGEPEYVGASLEHSDQGWQVEEAATLILRYSGGVRGVMSCFWNHPGKHDMLEIHATAGKAIFNPLSGNEYELIVNKESQVVQVDFPKNEHAPLINDFVESIIQDREPICSGIDGEVTTRIIENAYHSARESKFIYPDEN